MDDFGKILVIAPHPDDESIGCGGTIRKHANAGAHVKVIFLTSGENGGHGLSPEETSRVREAEAARAARILGVSEIDFWRLPDGTLRASADLIEHLKVAITNMKPDLVLAPYGRDMHSDHQATARALRRIAPLDGLDSIPILMYEVWTPVRQIDHIEDITAEISVKLRAIRAHKTQCSVIGFVEAFRALARYRGEMHSWPGGPYAEVFERFEV